LDVFGQSFNGPLAPAIVRDPPADVFADLPIEVNQGGIDGGDCPRSRSIDQRQDLIEVRGRRYCIRPFGHSLSLRAFGRVAH
jgi:hypothetical protein